MWMQRKIVRSLRPHQPPPDISETVEQELGLKTGHLSLLLTLLTALLPLPKPSFSSSRRRWLISAGSLAISPIQSPPLPLPFSAVHPLPPETAWFGPSKISTAKKVKVQMWKTEVIVQMREMVGVIITVVTRGFTPQLVLVVCLLLLHGCPIQSWTEREMKTMCSFHPPPPPSVTPGGQVEEGEEEGGGGGGGGGGGRSVFDILEGKNSNAGSFYGGGIYYVQQYYNCVEKASSKLHIHQLLLFLMFQLLSVLSCQCTNLLGVGYVFMYQKNCSSTQSVARGVSSVWENVCCVTSWCAGGGASLSYGRQQVMAARDKNKGKRLSLRDTLHGRQVRGEKKR